MVSAELEIELNRVDVDTGEDRGGGNTSGCSSDTVNTEQQPRDASPPPQSWLQRHLSSIGISTAASRLAAIVTLVLSCVVVWPTVTSAADARMSTALAKWTSQKDFFEFCETHDWKPENCAPLKDRPLPPPPTRFILLRRWHQGEPLDSTTHTTSFTLPALVYCAGLVCFTLALAKIVTTWRLYNERERARVEILPFPILRPRAREEILPFPILRPRPLPLSGALGGRSPKRETPRQFSFTTHIPHSQSKTLSRLTELKALSERGDSSSSQATVATLENIVRRRPKDSSVGNREGK